MVAGFVVTVVSCVGIGAWLVVQGHPWFALFAMLIGGSIRMRQSNEDEKPSKEQRRGEILKHDYMKDICRSSGTDSD